MALGWEVGYDDLFTLAEHTRSLVECFDVLEEMKRASPHRRVTAALIFLGERRDREAAAKKVLRVVKP